MSLEGYAHAKYKAIKIVETIIFIVSWTIIMLLGADFPPPSGFWIVIIGILILACIQWFYMNWILARIYLIKSLFISILIFASIGLIDAVAMALLLSQNFYDSFIIWLSICTIVAALYGLIFWFSNRVVYNHIKRKS